MSDKQREIPKTYDAAEVESKWYDQWKDKGHFKPKKGKRDETFSIIMPPPNVTGKLHMGHALDQTCQDVLVRYKRMKGFETLWVPGQDHAGIATQAVVEKELFATETKTRHDLGREEFLKLVWEWKEKNGDFILNQLTKLGVSADWDNFVFTMDDLPNRAVKKAFVQWFNEGLIYQSDYIVNWDPVLQSAISDAEVEHEEVEGAFYYITYKIKDSDEALTIATTRPETLLGDTGVAVNPNDDRFKHLIGKKAIIPIVNREVPIVGDDYVNIELGTGCLKVTPGHDFNDFEIGQRHQLPIINILNDDGTLNEVAPAYQGLSVTEARKKVLQELENLNQFIKKEKTRHQVGHGQRSGHIVEPRVSKQWFVNIDDMAAQACKAVEDGDMQFFPKGWENTYFSFLRNPRPWCISRQLWWGHRIPAFYCDECGYIWATEDDNPKTCTKCNSNNIRQDQDVLDTWFSSGLWAMSTLGWPDEKLMEEKGFERFFPTSTLVTGFDIIFFWVARMMMMTQKLKGDVPFKETYIHAIVRDKYGRKMSKSLGNGLDPLDLIKDYGADAMRFALAAGSGYNRGLNLDPARIEGYRNFINKLWNAFRFIYPFLNEAEDKLPETLEHHDRWILSELNEIATKMNSSMDEYRFDDACSAIYSFVYDKFCSWYIELSKKVLYSDDENARIRRASVLKYCYKQIVALLHPIIPFISEELWDYLKSGEQDLLIVQDYPELCKELNFHHEQADMNRFIETVSTIRNLRQSVNIPPKEEVNVILQVEHHDLRDYFAKNEIFFKDLARTKTLTIESMKEEKPKKSLSFATPDAEIYLPLEGLVDVDKHISKLEKNLSKGEKELHKLEGKLGNKKFVEKAPEEVIHETKEKKSALEKQVASLSTMIKNLKY
ncbi:MAG: valine--tRNA ligase [Bacteriovoracia bacterium]